MAKLTTHFKTIALALAMSSPFAQAAEPNPAKYASQQSYGSKFIKNPNAPVTEADQAYRDIPGNEFTIIMTGVAFPNGKKVTIDPDDMMPYTHPETGKAILVPRYRFINEINRQLPEVGGIEFPRSQPGQDTGVKGITGILNHVVVVHGVPKKQIHEAMYRCNERRAIPAP